jgi:hypothetical protein
MILLPSREKVAAKPTDEGAHRPVRRLQRIRLSTPHPTSLREATFSRKGRRIRAYINDPLPLVTSV